LGSKKRKKKEETYGATSIEGEVKAKIGSKPRKPELRGAVVEDSPVSSNKSLSRLRQVQPLSLGNPEKGSHLG
jgi:hypothetical protein